MATVELDSKEMRERYPSNSNASKTRKVYSKIQQEDPQKVPAKKIKKVTNAKVRKQSLVKKFGKSLIEDSIESVKEKAYNEIIVPGFKTLIFDTLTDMLGGLLFGGDAPRSDKRYGYGRTPRRDDKVSYTRYYQSSVNAYGSRDRDRERGYTRYEPDDIIVDTRAEARNILDALDEIIHVYGQASIADYYDLVGVTSEFTDNGYGWTSLRDAHIKPTREGFMILLPRTRILED